MASAVIKHFTIHQMIHHIEIYVSDLDRAIRFWSPLMEMLNCTAERWSKGINYFGADDEPYLCLVQAAEAHRGAGYHRKRIGLNHIAFRARSREHVDRIRGWAKDAGHTLLYDDRYPFATAPGYYALFFEDPDRIKIEIVAPGEP
ncbi:MAG TPA: VOC family protein [Tepidisphaeraceae bacterium]|nr:VOC family protein [Tepidisphaeraceae bacterium]